MLMQCPTVRVKSDDPDVEYVVINEADFDPEVHELFEAAKPSDGLKVEELKEALMAKGIDVPEGARKADLQALLDRA